MNKLILGFDAFDPYKFEQLLDKGSLPNLAEYIDTGGYAHFSISNPPQSEVSWTSIATGLNPGSHGIFDFVHRNPKNYQPIVSLLPTKSGLGGTQFVPPFSADTIFEYTVRQGYPATSLWWPATFPARPESPVKTLPGLGTPDILGRLGVGTLFTTVRGLDDGKWKTSIESLQREGKDRFTAQLSGPIRKKRQGSQTASIKIDIELIDEKTARLLYGNQKIDLVLGEWSPILEVVFKVGFFYKIHAITRVILTGISPDLQLYFLPLQIHPLHTPWRYASPKGFVKKTWRDNDPFLTLGWPQDTTGLEEGWINDQQFLDLCESIFQTRERILFYHLENFNEGILASVFDTLDRVQHMFWRDRQDIIEGWYIRLDGMVGRLEKALLKREHTRPHIIIVSDHGFANFDYKIHLNRWLVEKGYLTSKSDGGPGSLKDVDWSRSQAYAIGLNSLYLNLAGREAQGIVKVNEIESITQKLCDELHSWEGPNGDSVVQRAYPRGESLSGSLVSYGPDILVGYSPGYRASQQTGLGNWEADSLEQNRDHWRADHCIDPQSIPGVLLSNRGLNGFSKPSYTDFPRLILGRDLESKGSEPPPGYDDTEDSDVVEERLKSLGYL